MSRYDWSPIWVIVMVSATVTARLDRLASLSGPPCATACAATANNTIPTEILRSISPPLTWLSMRRLLEQHLQRQLSGTRPTDLVQGTEPASSLSRRAQTAVKHG